MIKKFAFFIMGLMVLPTVAVAAPCSRINLTKCLDSACAINLSSNPGARCQYCGTADAGTPAAGLKSISAGASSKNTISAKELKTAPTDPGERYVWATKKCLDIVQNCTTDDVEEAYDPLIEKSCTAAGISSDMARLSKKATTNKKTKTSCSDEISVCLTAADKCDTNYSKCADESAFNNFFASCSAKATGCTSFVANIRTELDTARKSSVSGASKNIDNIVAAHKAERENKVASIKNNCKSNANFNTCVKTVCKNNTANNCGTAAEKTIANSLCEFHKTACTKVK